MVQRERLNAEALGFQDGLRLFHLQGRETDFICQPVSIITEEEFEDGAEIHRREDVQRRLPALHPQRTEQAEDAENVVPVDVGEENGIQLHHRNPFLHQAVLGTLATINKEQAPVHLQCLGALVPGRHGHRRSGA